MLIGIAHPSFAATGGAEILAVRHAQYLKSLGHDIRIVTTAFDKMRWPHLSEIAEIRVVGKRWTDGFGYPITYTKLRRRAGRQAAALRGAAVSLGVNFPANIVAAEVRGVRRSVWYCNEPSRRLYLREASPNLMARASDPAASRDNPLVADACEQLVRHDAVLARQGKLFLERQIDALGVQHLTRIVANSCFIAGVVRQVYGRAVDAVIHPTVAIVENPPARHGGGLDRAGVRVLVHSRLEPVKNIAMVLRGFHAFTSRHPGAHELHVVGQGQEEPNLRAVARELGIEPLVRFHGFLDQQSLEAVYARCEVMALLPADEPFGMVYPEAAQRGLLLIGPDHGGPVEILDGGALGWTVDIFSPEPLAEAFAEAWRLPAHEVTRRRERAAAACHDRYGPHATLPALLAQLVD
jgi:glycosyltransferase involved in cell wall biosynthesis